LFSTKKSGRSRSHTQGKIYERNVAYSILPTIITYQFACGRRLWWRPVKVLIHYTFFKTNFHGFFYFTPWRAAWLTTYRPNIIGLSPVVVQKQCFRWLNCYVRIVISARQIKTITPDKAEFAMPSQPFFVQTFMSQVNNCNGQLI
jgi:hypothetical protein